MKKQLLALTGGVVMLLAGSVVVAGEHTAHWSYSGHTGPEHWGEMSEKFETCASGKNQSPIDISHTIKANMETIQCNYKASAINLIDNGHAIQDNCANGSQISLEGNTYKLLQYHFHTPSENTIQGQSFPMEAHFVHADENGNLAVIGVMFKIGRENPTIAKLWEHMPTAPGETYSDATTGINPADLLPVSKDYYRFNGSLTTPPCTEGVKWMVMKEAVEVSEEQVKKFKHVMHGDTNRPVQPVNARPILM